MQDPKDKKSKTKSMAKPVMMERIKVASKLNVKAPSKEDVESKIGRIKAMGEEAEDIRIGEKDFGPKYRELNLKGQRQVVLDKDKNASIRAKYTSKEGEEEVSRIPNSDILQVKKLGLGAQTDEPSFKESIKERIGRVESEKKAALKSKALEILKKARFMDQMKKN